MTNASLERGSVKTGVTLNALFSLREGIAQGEFFPALIAFCQHLKDIGYAEDYRCSRRLPLQGFGEQLPDFDYHVMVEFADSETEMACYNYVRQNQEPVRSLHLAMNSKVLTNAHFYLTSCCPGDGTQ